MHKESIRENCDDRVSVCVEDPVVVLEENMVLNIETPYYELGWGGVQVEDTIAITKNGAVRLDQTDNHMIVLEF